MIWAFITTLAVSGISLTVIYHQIRQRLMLFKRMLCPRRMFLSSISTGKHVDEILFEFVFCKTPSSTQARECRMGRLCRAVAPLPRHPMRHGADRRQYGQHCCNIMPSWTSSVLRTGGRQSFAFERAHGRAPRRHSIGLAAASTSCATGRHRG